MGTVNNARITELRRKRKWEQQQLAKEAGVAKSVISRLERGLQDDFKISVIAAVARALGVSVDSLLLHPSQVDTDDIDGELQEIMVKLSKQPKSIQHQAAGIIRGYLATLPLE